MSLVELVVTISIIGVLALAIASSIWAIFSVESTVRSVVTEAHDRQQMVNYFPGDVQAGPTDPHAYRVDSDADRGSGCSAIGTDNVFRIDYGSTFVAYRLDDVDPNDGITRLDRYVCNTVDATTVSVINIADRLVVDGVTSPIVTRLTVKAVPAGPVQVDRVTLDATQPGGTATFSASPRAEADLSPAVIAAECTSPTGPTRGFSTFVQGDVLLVDGTSIKWASALGGTLSFTGNVSVGQTLNHDEDLPDIAPLGAALYIGHVDWASSSGVLTIHAGRDIVIDDRSNSFIAANGKSAHQLGGASSPSISAGGQSHIRPIEETIDFANDFAVLRACAVRLAQLPGSCAACATHLDIRDQQGYTYPNGYIPGSSMKVVLVPGRANVLNITAAEFEAMGHIGFDGQKPATSTPLIVNIVDSGEVVISTYPQMSGHGEWVASMLWNFPNASVVRLESNEKVWGTVFAPQAHVISSVAIEGGVVAASWTHEGDVTGARVFTGVIGWDP